VLASLLPRGEFALKPLSSSSREFVITSVGLKKIPIKVFSSHGRNLVNHTSQLLELCCSPLPMETILRGLGKPNCKSNQVKQNQGEVLLKPLNFTNSVKNRNKGRGEDTACKDPIRYNIQEMNGLRPSNVRQEKPLVGIITSEMKQGSLSAGRIIRNYIVEGWS
jgi:hypothetical protein